ncbi:MAG TPA: tetratricopeptide repeat protein [Nitrospirales bacterium]|nr:hypothetical protein [Nitrospiraceae bacterium]HNP30985.1 tetratricopeptide repeat protein [Nitrospirales bacterium]
MTHPSTLKFCGRTDELDQLTNLWRLASNVESPSPQVVVIKAEPGVGKTRLVLEFYRRLSETFESKDEVGYWPKTIDAIESNLEINPNADKCTLQTPIPFLWWGLRAGDHGAENSVAGDAIATYDKFLAPHLVTLLVRSVMKKRGIGVIKAWAEVGVNAASSFFQIDNILNVGKGIFTTAQILTGAFIENAQNEALKRPASRANAVLSDMEKVFYPKNITYAKTPGIIFLDDVQFALKDAALPYFIECLIHKAVTQKWPMLILTTHWKAQFSPKLMSSEQSFTGIIHHFLEADKSGNGPSANRPGGCLDSGNYTEIDLDPIPDLREALLEKLPGLTNEQASTILEITGGNPRYLEQLVKYAATKKSYFQKKDIKQPLLTNGLALLVEATKSRKIFDVVRLRLLDTPREVQEAICLASLQGMRFASELVDALAHEKLGESRRDHLGEADDPYSFVTGMRQPSEHTIGQFAERLFLQVAKDIRPDLDSLPNEHDLQMAFKEMLANQVDSQDFEGASANETQLLVYGIAADVFEKSDVASERAVAQRALGLLAYVELSRFSLEAATAAYERLLAIIPTGSETLTTIKTLDFLATAYRKLNWPSKCSGALKRVISKAYSLIGENGRILAFANDHESVTQYFEEWKTKQIAAWREEKVEVEDVRMQQTATTLYLGAVSRIVDGLLQMSELARAWPNLSFDEKDDPIDPAPFMVKGLDLDDSGNIVGDTEIGNDEASKIHKNWAYNLGVLLGNGIVERKHFNLLDELANSANHDNDFTAAESLLTRALEIARHLGDHIGEIQVLNNLGLLYGQIGDREKSKKTLLEAGRLSNKLYAGDAFSVVALSSDGSVEFRRFEAVSEADQSLVIGRMNIPIRFASTFDKDSEGVVRQFRRLVQIIGNIEGNLGNIALSDGEFEKAKERYENAITSYADLNDGPSIAMTLKNLGAVAKGRGDRDASCDYWRQSISVYEKLKVVDSGKINEACWENAIQELQQAIKESVGMPEGPMRFFPEGN